MDKEVSSRIMLSRNDQYEIFVSFNRFQAVAFFPHSFRVVGMIEPQRKASSALALWHDPPHLYGGVGTYSFLELLADDLGCVPFVWLKAEAHLTNS